jgi:dolichol-phosphate mannosyltransferase
MASGSPFKVVLVAPAYNEQGKIGNVVRRALPFVDEVVVADDGSADQTAKEARNAGATVIRFEQNRGVGAAIRAGIDHALKRKYDIAIICGGDDQDSLEDIPLYLAAHARGYAFVQGSRYMPGGKTDDMPLARLLMTKGFTWFVNLMARSKLSDASNGFRGIDLRALRNLTGRGHINLHQPWLDRYCLEIYLLYKLLTTGIRYTELPVTKTFHRKKGYTKMRVIVDWWQVLKPLILLRLGLKK